MGLPPLVGYLAAGFALHAFGQELTPGIEVVADVGVLLLLFGIGLKLRLRTLGRPEVWVGATLHMAGATAILGTAVLALGAAGLPPAAGLGAGEAAVIGFALAFSSTVFAVKALEERSEASSVGGRIAIGILIVQDVAAVVFLTLAVDAPPSLWALPAGVALVAARPLWSWLLDRTGHGELLVLLGFCLAVGAAELFSEVGLKPDLGALVIGMVLAGHRRAPELADRLLGFKDVLLVGFFLSIGLGGAPGPAELGVALVVLAVLPVKTLGYLVVLSRFRLRSRTIWHASVTLADYSEFGLIVIAVAIDQGLVTPEWASAMAVAVAASFVVAAPLNTARYRLYARWSGRLARLERHPIRADDALIEPGDAAVMVFGMGRVGAGAYDELVRRRGRVVLGVDRSEEAVAANLAAGRTVVRGDALDSDFWDRVTLHQGIELVVFAMSDHRANLEAVRRVREFLPGVRMAASATYPDEVGALEHAGVDVARNLYGEAGQGLADDACDLLDADRGPEPGE